jgi:hypothetical protein
MAEGATDRVGKFTIIEEAESKASPIYGSEGASEEGEQKSAQDSVDAFTIKSSQPRRRGKAAAPKPKPVIQAISEAPASHSLHAQLLIASGNMVVITWLGTECAMEKREAEMLEPPVGRLLARLSPADSEKLSTFIDPLVILIALGTWGNRIIRIQRAKRGSISDTEFARATGMADSVPTPSPDIAPQREEVYQPIVEPNQPPRSRVPVNPNGIPVTITQQIGEV